MSKREKVILILMVLTLLGGGYIYFFSSPTQIDAVSPEKEAVTLDKFMTDLAKSLKNTNLSKNDAHILSRAEMKWPKDPLLDPGVIVKSEVNIEKEEVVHESVSFTYSGFLDIGSQRLAIIDGMEYEAGEALMDGKYFLKKITPVQIVIGVKGGEKEMIFPLEEGN